MKDLSTERQADAGDIQQRRRLRMRVLVGIVIIVGAFGIASRPRLNATERKLVGVWEGAGNERGSRVCFEASRRYRMESSTGSVPVVFAEGDWTVREGKLRLFDDARVPTGFFPRLVWRISHQLNPRGGMTGALEFTDDRTFRWPMLRGTWQRAEPDEASPQM